MGALISKPKKKKSYVLHIAKVIIKDNTFYLCDKDKMIKVIASKIIEDSHNEDESLAKDVSL
jgi:hypothetical protein